MPRLGWARAPYSGSCILRKMTHTGISGPEFSGPSWFAAALSQPLEASSNRFPTSPAREKLIVSIPALLAAFLV